MNEGEEQEDDMPVLPSSPQIPFAVDTTGSDPGIIVAQQLYSRHHQGPLPPPDILKQYEATVKGAANRIIRMAEQEAKHRHSIEHKLTDAKIEDMKSQRAETNLGQRLAGSSVFVACITAMTTSYWGDTVTASIVGGTTIVALVAAFIGGQVYSSKSDNRNGPSDSDSETNTEDQSPEDLLSVNS